MIPGLRVVSSWTIVEGRTGPADGFVPPTEAQLAADQHRRERVRTEVERRRKNVRRRKNLARRANGARARRTR